jgi:hypothetical protein
MQCGRCRSMMVVCGPLRFQAMSTDMSDPAQHLPARKCPCCGNYEDKQVVKNRTLAGVR